jgi:hypothetical protein
MRFLGGRWDECRAGLCADWMSDVVFEDDWRKMEGSKFEIARGYMFATRSFEGGE